MVAHRTLTPFVRVRILLPLPKKSSPSERMGCFSLSEHCGKDGKPAFRWKQEHMKKGVDILENPLKSDIEKARIEAVR